VTPRFPSGVGHGAMRARLESPRVCYATPGVRIGTTRASRQRQLPTKRCHAARLFGATRAYQPDSSSQPLHRQPRASVLGNCSAFTPARREPQHRLRDPARHSKPLDSWSFHISRHELWRRVGSHLRLMTFGSSRTRLWGGDDGPASSELEAQSPIRINGRSGTIAPRSSNRAAR